MNKHLQKILKLVTKNQQLPDSEKKEIESVVNELDKTQQLEKSKLERAENDKRAMTVMLEESRQALETKTKAIETQERELEIEAALERVRTRAMAMSKPADLSGIGETIFTELKALDFTELRNTEIIINNDSKETIVSYYYSDYGVTGIIEIDYKTNPVVNKWANEMRKADDAFTEITIPESEIEEWRDYRLSLGYLPDPKLDEAKEVFYYSYSIGLGALSISSFKPISDEQVKALERFRNVFDLAYKRYTDISLAEAQARESQIQLALERVRARTMAMQKSEELNNVVSELYQQIHSLEFSDYGCTIIICQLESQALEHWYAGEDQVQSRQCYNVPLTGQPVSQKQWNSWLEEVPEFKIYLKGKDKTDYTEFMLTDTDHKHFPDDVKKEWRAPEDIYFYYVRMKYGLLEFVNIEPFDEENFPVYRRFAKVFEQTYTRFLDLQKAEAQARESQIQLALERVRARTMAMQTSAELADTAAILFKQLSDLGIAPNRLYIMIFNDETGDMEAWGTAEDGKKISQTFKANVSDTSVFREMYEGWTGQKSSRIIDLKGKKLTAYIRFLSEQLQIPVTTGHTQKRRVQSVAYFAQGLIGMASPEPPPDEIIRIQERFARVFEQTYTRFLDLKQAEAQAREAHIETALERVRARTMAMYQSDELAETAGILFEQMTGLGMVLKRCVIGIFDAASASASLWFTRSDGKVVPESDSVPLTEQENLRALFQAWKEKELFYTFELIGESRMAWTRYMMEKANMRLPEYQPDKIDRQQLLSEPAVFNCFFFSYGMLMLHTTSRLAKADIAMLTRFARVFEQTYRRFLDLQKAEEQAREAQIEAALERVRARTMAMHRSDELSETAAVLFQQLNDLGIDPERIFIGIVHEDTAEIEFWVTEQGGSQISDSFSAGIDEETTVAKTYSAWKANEPVLIIDLFGKELMAWIRYLREQLGMPFKEEYLREHRIHSIAFFSQGMIGITTPDKRPTETMDLLKRFARVFEQTYTRFLDLQKAEAQAREAQIEAALERVRSRTMAMQRSDELKDAAALLFEQVEALGVPVFSCGYNIWEKGEKECTAWMSDPKGGGINPAFKIPLTEDPNFIRFYESRQNGEEFYVLEMTGRRMQEHYRYLRKTIPVFDETFSELEKAGHTLPETQIHHLVNFEHGNVMFITLEPCPEDHDIFKRFAKVFELTYTRFLDLQKAEARAREAEQEASLDRVRAEIASMRTADDLQRITPLIWRELTTLGVPFFRCGIFIIDEATEQAHVYLSTPSGEAVAALHLKFDSTTIIAQTVKHWREQKVYREEWDRQQFIAWTQSMIERGQIDSPKKYQAGEEPPEHLVLQFVPFTQGMLYIGSASRLSDQEINVAQALADAFAVAYARYEDFTRLEAANQRKADELEEARQLQLAMLPKTIPKLPDLEIAAYMQTATEVGGDYYDFDVDPYGTLTIAIGDATGHGLKAGTIVASTKSLFKAMAHEPYPAEVLKKISFALKSMGFTRMFMGMTVAKLSNHRLTLSAGGMPLALINRIETGKTEQVVLKAPPLGSFPDFQYEQKVVALKPGDTVLFLSDGLEETFNSREQMLGERRVRKLFREVANEKPKKIIEHLVKAAQSWSDGQAQRDDITIMVVKMK